MKKQDLKLIGAFFALTVASTGCGSIDDIIGTSCPASGFKLATGSYVVDTADAQVTDTCNSPALTQAELLTQVHSITTDTTANPCVIIIKGGSAEIGRGSVSNNTGAFLFGPSVEKDAAPLTCQYTVTINSTFTLTADNTYSLTYNETENNWMTQAGASPNCVAPPGNTCTIAYKLNMKKQ